LGGSFDDGHVQSEWRMREGAKEGMREGEKERRREGEGEGVES
jgi:hypothetical protein